MDYFQSILFVVKKPALSTYLTLTCCCLLLCFSPVAFSQKDSIGGSIHLQEVRVVDKGVDKLYAQSRFSLGTRLQVADSAVIAQLQNSSLSEYLLRNTSIFIKESGNGMLSSVSLRGTSSSHTAVSWNGLNINPLTMGQVDFSQLPLFFFEKIAVHPGGESALYGNGSIGGSILLGSDAEYKKRWTGLVQESVGSYGYNFSGAKVQGGTDKWQTRTALMYTHCENDFDIKRASFSGIKKEKQQNAEYWNYGFLQDVAWKISKQNELTLNAWHTYYYRQIQPSIQNNKDTASYDDITSRNTRVVATFKHRGAISWASRMAYIDDYQLNLGDVIATNNYIVGADAEKSWKRFSFKGGASAQYIAPHVYSYDSGVTEWRENFYLLSRCKLSSRWDADVNLCQNFVSGIHVPFTPSAGTSYKLLRTQYNELSVRANCSRSFKVPTLNDRYWGGLDNRYLKPEDGVNTEAGLDYLFHAKKYSAQLNASAYYNRVKNWIMWMPRGNTWKPQNVDLVAAKGIEASLKQTLSLHKLTVNLTLNCAYTLTTVLEGFDDMTPFRNRQMPLLPKYTANGLLQVEYNRAYFTVNTCYVGERATSNVYDIMEAYVVTNVSAGYNFHIGKQMLSLSAQLNNVFNEEYETVPFRAMPLQNWTGTLKWIF
jgi:iron complex outermembrane receptor protein